MSLPVERIYCDGCDFRSNSTVTSGHYLRRLADGREISLYRRLGWCHTCHDIVPVENLPDRETLAEGIRELESRIRASTRSARLFPWKRNKARYEEESWRGELEEVLSRRDFLSRRQSPPRCLRCASAEIVALEYVTPEVGAPPTRIDFIHPGCGGSLWMVSDGLRLNLRFSETLLYDGEGRQLGRRKLP